MGVTRAKRSSRRRWIQTILIGAVAALLVAVGLAAFWPVHSDEENGYKGAVPKIGGLFRPFPAMVTHGQNQMTPDRVELGRELFFDPILSGDNSISCATCHHPDLGFTDGRGLSMGVGGKGLSRAREGGAVI